MTIRPMFFVFTVLATSISLLVILLAAYLYSQFELELIEEGSFVGLTIGESKIATYEKIPRALVALDASDPRIFVEIKVDDAASEVLSMGIGRHAMVQSTLEESGFERFQQLDQWRFYIGGSYMNLLTVEFCDDKLCRISRMKKPFELP